MSFEIVYTVCADSEEAEEISQALLSEKLAACTNRFNIHSDFRWEGEIERKEEVAMIIKTREENVPDVFDRIREMHSYDAPALFSLPVSFVEDDYLEWVFEETEPSS